VWKSLIQIYGIFQISRFCPLAIVKCQTIHNCEPYISALEKILAFPDIGSSEGVFYFFYFICALECWEKGRLFLWLYWGVVFDGLLIKIEIDIENWKKMLFKL